MDRREFIKTSIVGAGALWLTDWEKAFAAGTHAPEVGKVWKGWKKGHFQVHFIYTGVGESMFYIFPDGTTMLLDCGDHNAIGRKLRVPVLPNPDKHSGEWIARYVQRVNPHGNDVDYMMISHYHSDHAGCCEFFASKEMREGREYILSGFSQAGETLNFKKAIDRAWPGFDDPLPMPDGYDEGCIGLIRQFYDWHRKRKGLEIEKFKLGATDQIRMLHSPSAGPGFSIRNICGNGRICAPDGTVTDLYADRIRDKGLKSVNENGMSLGMIITYGDFKMYTAGDFSDNWDTGNGTRFEIEDAIADVCGHVNVAKINHHGHYSMTEKLIRSLSAQAYVSCVWDQLHNVSPVMDRLSDRNIYAGDRVVCPGIMPAERLAEDAGKEWLKDVPEASYEGGHIVLDVEKGGKKFSLSYLSAADESMTVRSVMNFRSR